MRQLQMAREAVRTQLLTLGAGVFAAGALVFTARNSIFAQRTVQLTEQGQVTERYARAIEQLGSEKLDVRIGGIYALERIARDSARDHPTVMEVLAAFVREHSREPWPLPTHGTALPGRSTRPNVQAAMTVIGRRTTEYDGGQIDLRGANLSGAQLDGANLRWTNLTRVFANQAKLDGAQFRSAELPEVDFSGAKLCGAGFTDAKLPDAFMPGADLTGAHFQKADLTRANLMVAVLAGAYLRGANLTSANLIQTDLSGADLAEAMMREANLTDAILAGADLTKADLSTARLANTNFTEANLMDAWFPTAVSIPDGWVAGHLGRLTRSKVDPSPDLSRC